MITKNDFSKKTTLIHLSHTDLDGYGSQYITHESLTPLFKKVEYFNTNYGEEVEKNIDLIFDFMLKNIKEEYVLLITDFNLTQEQANRIDYFRKSNPTLKLKIQLLDHHASGKEVAQSEEAKDYYHLDASKCATKLTQELCESLNPNCEINDYLCETANIVNSHDMWLENDSNFRYANFLNDKIEQAKHPKALINQQRTHKFFMISKLAPLIINKTPIVDIEDLIPKFFREYINQHSSVLDFFQDMNISSEHKLFYLWFDEMNKNRDKLFKTITIEGQKGLMIYNLNVTEFQYISKYFLKLGVDISFMISITQDGKISIRSNPTTNAGEVCRKYFNGNGHPPAAGGFLLNSEKLTNLTTQKEVEKILINHIVQIDKNIKNTTKKIKQEVL